jgi:hypothetical protein
MARHDDALPLSEMLAGETGEGIKDLLRGVVRDALQERRAVEPWVVRDTLCDAALKATDVGTEALATRVDRGAKALRDRVDRRRTARGSEEPDVPETD